ncbi:ABC transporter permease [Salipaludibacillus agaradhaerens]|uniref:ABC transporter permease n=1 Tax=Salipaludibacillus agaradhaerens TaxID=76935 RepID=UPI000997EF26
MLKLICLEMKKHKMFGYIKAAFIANIIMILLACIIPIIERMEGEEYFINFEMMFMMINTMVRGTFIIFSGVLIAKLIIDEYKKKTMQLLFMYPQKRHKFILAKLLIVSLFTFLSVVLSNFIVSAAFYGINSIAHLITDQLTLEIILEQAITVLFSAVSLAGIGLIPLYFGMIKKSVSVTIVSAILLFSVIGSNFAGFSLFNVVAIPVTLSAIGFIIAYLSFRNIENVDVL